uniref:Uncharacterized protein n=1 Tax=Caenorhabditis japonica TaxID=281687 RepID=A0A8R1I8N9_CAEJA
MKDLFEDWDPILNLPASSAPHPAQPPPKIAKTTPALPPIAQAHAPEDPSISGLLSPKEDPSITGILLPKEEPVEDETLEYSVLDEPIDEREMKLINDLFRSKKSLSGLDETQQPTMRIPRKFMGEDDMSNTVYTISCEFPVSGFWWEIALFSKISKKKPSCLYEISWKIPISGEIPEIIFKIFTSANTSSTSLYCKTPVKPCCTCKINSNSSFYTSFQRKMTYPRRIAVKI